MIQQTAWSAVGCVHGAEKAPRFRQEFSTRGRSHFLKEGAAMDRSEMGHVAEIVDFIRDHREPRRLLEVDQGFWVEIAGGQKVLHRASDHSGLGEFLGDKGGGEFQLIAGLIGELLNADGGVPHHYFETLLHRKKNEKQNDSFFPSLHYRTFPHARNSFFSHSWSVIYCIISSCWVTLAPPP